MIENYGDQFRGFIGVVTQNVDPMQLGRVQVRIYGVHPDVEENLVLLRTCLQTNRCLGRSPL